VAVFPSFPRFEAVIFLEKSDPLAIVYDYNPLKTKDLLSSKVVHNSVSL
jgi:hypothetical protein